MLDKENELNCTWDEFLNFKFVPEFIYVYKEVKEHEIIKSIAQDKGSDIFHVYINDLDSITWNWFLLGRSKPF